MHSTQLTVTCNFSETSSSLQELSQVPSLLQEYKSCLATRKFDEGKKINNEINYLITNEINTTGWDLIHFADNLLFKADFFEESIPVFFAAASLCEKNEDIGGMSTCIGFRWDIGWGGMYGANKRMIERDVTMKEVVKRHVIPLMHHVKNQMLEMTSVSDSDKLFEMSLVLECIAGSEELVDDDVAAKEAKEQFSKLIWMEKRGKIEEKKNRPWWKKIKDAL